MQLFWDAVRRRVPLWAAIGAAVLAAGCGHHSTSNAVGVGVGVQLTAPAGSTIVEQTATLEIDATVSGDPTNSGVTWALIGAGSAQSSTSTKYVYQAPGNISGALTVTLTATSVKDPNQVASVTITVNGTPVIPAPVLFPANLNIGYVAYFTVVGGLSPFTWSLTSGTLPAGLTLDGSTAATTALSGIPTALGSSTFTLQAVDSAGNKASVTVTLVVNPQTACVLYGHFGYLFSGFRDQLPVVRAGSLDIQSDGTITGVHDYKDDQQARIDEALTDGTCTTVSQNRGTLRLVSPTRIESFDFGTVSALNVGHMQENDSTPIVGSAQFFKQNVSAFTAGSVAGDYAFGLIGVDANGARLGVVGRLTVDAAGLISNGAADTNQSTPLVAGVVGGSLSAPDANGRGTTTLTVGNLSLPLAFYVVDANTIYLVSDDNSARTARLIGRMTRQVGAGTLSGSALAGASVVSLWGSSIVRGLPTATVAAGLLFSGNGSTLTAGLDVVDRGTPLVHTDYAAAPYTVTADGRGTLTLTSSGVSRQFVLYMAGAGSGYLLEPASVVGNWGVLDAQSGAPFSDFLSAYYVGGTVFATSTSPITLVPQLLFQEGALSGNVTGTYAIDPATGRAIATVSRNILGGSGLVVYIVSSSKLVVLGDGVNSVNGSLGWLQGY
jgi:hypothetical protein